MEGRRRGGLSRSAARTEHVPQRVPDGVSIVPLVTHRDTRGELTEVFRRSWHGAVDPVQWNVVRSDAGVLRGVHCHVDHWDWLILASGACSFGLADLRRGSPTERLAVTVEARGQAPFALVIPPGVAHGFLFTEPSVHVYGVTHYWNLADELGCRFDDPELGIPWPTRHVTLSPRDEALPPLRDLLPHVPPWRPSLRVRDESGERVAEA